MLRYCDILNILTTTNEDIVNLSYKAKAKWHLYSVISRPYPHALESRQRPQGPQGSECPQRFDGAQLRVAQSVGYKAD